MRAHRWAGLAALAWCLLLAGCATPGLAPNLAA
jgi:hypothetical protein